MARGVFGALMAQNVTSSSKSWRVTLARSSEYHLLLLGDPTLTKEVSKTVQALPRPEILTVAEPTLAERLLVALRNSVTDWRTVKSLAEELGVAENQVLHSLRALGDRVRRPVGQEKRYPDWYRLSERGLTRQERWARFKAVVTSSSMDDDF